MDEDPFGFGFGVEDPALAAPGQLQAGKTGPASHAFPEEDEDIFGFGGGFDDEDQPMRAQPSKTALPNTRTQLESGLAATSKDGTNTTVRESSAPQHATTMMEDDEDVFGFGGGFDEPPESAAQPQVPQVSQATGRSATALDEEDDPFGFGGGLDDRPVAAVPQPAAAPPS